MKDFLFSYENKYSFAHRYKATDEFISVGHFKEEYLRQCVENQEPARRTNENMIPDYVLFENDELPLEEQLAVINSIDHSCIRSITYSGGKSYHVLFKIDAPDDITNEEYKEIWEDIMKYFGLYDLADKNNTNVSRLTRNPNGYRRKYSKDMFGNELITPTHTKQTCIYDNPDCEAINISADLEVIRQKAIMEKAWAEEKKKRLDNVFTKLSMSPEEALSRIKKECEAKRGYEMLQNNDFPKGDNFLGCARGMYNVCMMNNCDEMETLEYVRSFLRAASEAHPSNISRNTANNWKPPRTYK